MRPVGGEGREPWGLKELHIAGSGTIIGISPVTMASQTSYKVRGVFFIPSPLSPDALSVLRDSPGHWGEPGVPARVLSPAPLDVSSVGTIVHKLQIAFQEALDLYHLVSQAQSQEKGLRECLGTACPGWFLTWLAPFADSLQ